MPGPGELGSRDARGNDPARFLQELRELRSHAGLGHAELAARAHYPCEAIRAAEAGPSLPDLPVLSAYVRGCGGTFAEWEERWRSLTGSPASPLLPARPTGCSAAASAGARVGATSAAADGHDPALVMAALGRVAEGMATSATSSLSASSPRGQASCLTGLAAPAELAGAPGPSGPASPSSRPSGPSSRPDASGLSGPSGRPADPPLPAATPARDSAAAMPDVAAADGQAAADGRRAPAPPSATPVAVARVPAHGSRRTLPPRVVVLAALIAVALVVLAAVVALVS